MGDEDEDEPSEPDYGNSEGDDEHVPHDSNDEEESDEELLDEDLDVQGDKKLVVKLAVDKTKLQGVAAIGLPSPVIETADVDMSHAAISARIDHLKTEMSRLPAQRENIQSIIEYYQRGGLPPVPGSAVVYSYGDGVKRNTMQELASDLKAHASGRLPYIDSVAYQCSQRSKGGSP